MFRLFFGVRVGSANATGLIFIEPGLISTRNGTVPGFGGSDRALAKEALRERPVVIAPQY
jgi:hypothetical protein